jgi:hypothetical protein
LNPKPYEAQIEDKKTKKTQKDHLKEEKTVRPIKYTKK